MGEYILAIDQGTTGSTAVVVSRTGSILGKVNREFPQHYPKPGWVEHDLADIWTSVEASIEAALEVAKVSPKECIAIGITNQR
ncbi:MAG: glycerol kinase, partial [Myxococcales bacterium]|nr:glycerol kinase [Myxococcales bacterium]